MWQDFAMTSIQWYFTVVLGIAVWRGGATTPLSTSLPSVIGLCGIAYVLGTLGLWYSVVPTIISACLWSTIAYQRLYGFPTKNAAASAAAFSFTFQVHLRVLVPCYMAGTGQGR